MHRPWQVSKMCLKDIDAKDFLLLNKMFGTEVTGYIDKQSGITLPNSEIPSDHTSLMVTLPKFRPRTVESPPTAPTRLLRWLAVVCQTPGPR